MSTGELSPAEVKSCCSTAYSSAAVRLLLGDRLHPGGAALTDLLIDALAVGPDAHVVDVASGLGASALQAAARTGCTVTGVDLSAANTATSLEAASAAGLADRVTFITGDAEALPLGDEVAKGVLCECALCTFPDKRAAVREIARILAPGGRLALSDVTADSNRLPAELVTLAARIACVADARPLAEVAAMLDAAGLTVESASRHDRALVEMLDRIDARLTLARIARPPTENLDGLVEEARRLLDAARRGVEAGVLGYGVMIARRR